MRREMVLRFGVAASLLLLIGGCSHEDEREAGAVAQPQVAAETDQVRSVPVDRLYISSGIVTSDHRVSISSRISGYIRTLTVREGDRVKVGDLLVRVDPVNANQRLVQAMADLANAKADLKRYEALFKEHATTKQQLDRVRLRYKVVASQVRQARNQLGYAEVRSPVNGVVVEKMMSAGDLAAPGATILTLEDPSSLLVNTYLSERVINQVKVGDAVDVRVPAMQRHLHGEVRQVVDVADAATHQFQVKVAVQDDALRSGMFAEVGFTLGQRQTLLIPYEAVVDRAGLNGVYLVDADRTVHYRQVRLGRRYGDRVELLAGLHAGDLIAWNGKPELRTGMKLQGK